VRHPTARPLRDYRCHSSAETIEKALTGSYRAEHLLRWNRHSPSTRLTTRRYLLATCGSRPC
jgi:hypothetical protein